MYVRQQRYTQNIGLHTLWRSTVSRMSLVYSAVERGPRSRCCLQEDEGQGPCWTPGPRLTFLSVIAYNDYHKHFAVQYDALVRKNQAPASTTV